MVEWEIPFEIHFGAGGIGGCLEHKLEEEEEEEEEIMGMVVVDGDGNESPHFLDRN